MLKILKEKIKEYKRKKNEGTEKEKVMNYLKRNDFKNNQYRTTKYSNSFSYDIIIIRTKTSFDMFINDVKTERNLITSTLRPVNSTFKSILNVDSYKRFIQHDKCNGILDDKMVNIKNYEKSDLSILSFLSLYHSDKPSISNFLHNLNDECIVDMLYYFNISR